MKARLADRLPLVMWAPLQRELALRSASLRLRSGVVDEQGEVKVTKVQSRKVGLVESLLLTRQM